MSPHQADTQVRISSYAHAQLKEARLLPRNRHILSGAYAPELCTCRYTTCRFMPVIRTLHEADMLTVT